jgi:hypothetical protein
MRTLSAFALAAVIWASACLAADKPPNWSSTAFMNGNQLYERCEGQDLFKQGVCTGYILGVMDDLQSTRSLAHLPPCGSDQITVKQLHDVVVKYLRDNPAQRHYSAVSLAGYAIIKAWCPPSP